MSRVLTGLQRAWRSWQFSLASLAIGAVAFGASLWNGLPEGVGSLLMLVGVTFPVIGALSAWAQRTAKQDANILLVANVLTLIAYAVLLVYSFVFADLD